MRFQSERDGFGGFNTQPPKGGWSAACNYQALQEVSTHSRLKAAGISSSLGASIMSCFNTQPPKGGWMIECNCARL